MSIRSRFSTVKHVGFPISNHCSSTCDLKPTAPRLYGRVSRRSDEKFHGTLLPSFCSFRRLIMRIPPSFVTSYRSNSLMVIAASTKSTYGFVWRLCVIAFRYIALETGNRVGHVARIVTLTFV